MCRAQAVLVLEACGFDVILPGHHCCGRPCDLEGIGQCSAQASVPDTR